MNSDHRLFPACRCFDAQYLKYGRCNVCKTILGAVSILDLVLILAYDVERYTVQRVCCSYSDLALLVLLQHLVSVAVICGDEDGVAVFFSDFPKRTERSAGYGINLKRGRFYIQNSGPI